MNPLETRALYDLSHTLAAPLLEKVRYPWEALSGIGAFIAALGPTLSQEEYASPRPGVWIHKTAVLAPTAFVGETVIIGPGAEVRHGAFIRGNVILFDKVQVPHYNYVGDSILGYRSHMGAGSITSNVKSDKTLVTIKGAGDPVETGLKKCGAMLGDLVEIGCGSVLNPGTVVGREASVYPLSMVRGYIPARSIYKKQGEVVDKR